MIEIRRISFGTSEYKAELALRDEVLRKPLGVQFSKIELAQEPASIHLGAFENTRLVGCLVLTALSKTSVKMRQVAVDQKTQGSGVGRKLVIASEALAIELGFTIMELSARSGVVPFYLKLGYEKVGAPFVEVTILHQKMKKLL